MTDNDTKPRYGSVYARGYNDGLRAAGITNPYEVPFVSSRATKGERSYKQQQSLIQLIDKAASGQANAEQPPVMNAKKFESTYQGLTSVARKVFDVTPIAEPWPINKIVSELARTGSNQDHRVVLGAIRDLCGRKLVHEVSIGMYQRIKIEQKPKPVEAKPMAEPKPIAEAKPKTADVLTIKATQKKKGPMELLADLASKARQFAEELDNAALEIEQEFQNSEAKSEQLKQLKSLLKGIAD